MNPLRPVAIRTPLLLPIREMGLQRLLKQMRNWSVVPDRASTNTTPEFFRDRDGESNYLPATQLVCALHGRDGNTEYYERARKYDTG
jgi:hypothetical protein